MSRSFSNTSMVGSGNSSHAGPNNSSSLQQQHYSNANMSPALHASANSATTLPNQLCLSMIIEYTPMRGAQVKRDVHNVHVNPEKRRWLVDFVTKDLVQLQTIAVQISMMAADAAAAAAAEAAAAGPPSTAQAARNLRNSVLSTINGSTTTSAAAAAAPIAGGAGGSGPPSGAVTSHDALGGGGGVLADTIDTPSFIKVISLDEVEQLTAVVMYFAIDAENGSFTGSLLSAAASHHAQMYAVAVFLRNTNSIRLRLALPSLRDWMVHSHQYIVSLADVPYDENNTIPEDDVDGNTVDVEAMWIRKLKELEPLLDTWTNHAVVHHNKIDLDSTVLAKTTCDFDKLYQILCASLSHHRCVIRSDDEREVELWLNTLALFYSDDRLLFSSNKCFSPSRMMSERPLDHDVGDTVFVNDGLPIGPKQHIWAPDLNLQGTTAKVSHILEHLHYFRCPPVVIDVSRGLDEPAHFFPKDRQVKFTEVRQKIFRRQEPLLPPNLLRLFPGDKTMRQPIKSALVSSICSRLKLIITTHAKQQSSTGVGSSSQLAGGGRTASRGSVDHMDGPTPAFLLAPAVAAHVNTATPPRTLASTSKPSSSTDERGGGGGVGALVFPADIAGATSLPSNSHATMMNVLHAVTQWRRLLTLRTLSYYYFTVQFRFESDAQTRFQPAVFKEATDDAILQVAVEFFAQIQEQKEKHARTVLSEAFAW